MAFLSDFYKNHLTMVYFFQNIRSLLSFRHICAPKHVQLQLSVGVINGWMDLDSIQLVMQNTINSWYHMSFMWTKQIIKRTKMSLMHKCFHQRYYVNFLVSEYLSFNLQSHAPDWWEKNVIDGYFPDFSNQNISNIYNPNKNLSLAFQTKCEIMFSDLGVGSYIFTSCFSQLRTWFIFCFFSYVVIINLLQR